MRRSARQLLVGVLAGTTTVTGMALAPLQAGAAPTARHSSSALAAADPAGPTPAGPTPAASARAAAPAAGATVGAAGADRFRPATARTLTLLTGDRVRVRTVAGRTTYAVSPARHSGPGAALRTLHVGSRHYVLPVVAQAYLGSTLDPALFEVSATAGAAAAPAQPVPVRITHTGGRPTVPGVTITADAGGVASGYLNKASARLFGDALVRQWTADRRAGRAQTSGLFAGIRRISTVDAAPVRVSPQFAMLTLVIKGIDADGRPMDGGSGLFMNVDDGRRYTGFVDIEGGEARVSLPAGRYSGQVDWAGMSATTHDLVVRSVPVPQFTVTSSGQRLTIDARQATAAPRATTPRPVGSDGEETFTYNRVDATGHSSIGIGNIMGTGSDYRVKPAPAVTVGTQGFTTAYHLVAPGAAPAYTYDLSFSSNAVAPDQTHRVTAAQVATVSARYDTDQPGRDVFFARYAIDPAEGWATFSLSPLRTPLRRTEYVAGAPGQLWGELEIGNDLADDPAGIDAVHGYPAGTQRPVSWRRGALGAGIPAQDTTAPGGSCSACRTGNALRLALAPFTDAEPDHVGELAPSPDGSPVTHLTLSSGRTVLVDRDDVLGADVKVPAGTASYKAVLDVDRSWAGTTTSTRSHTELTFPSSAGAGPAAPTSMRCSDDVHAVCRVLPVLQAKVVLPTSSTGTLPAGTSTVDVVATRVQGAAAAPVSSASLELRPAGFGWAAFPVKAVGGGRFRAAVDLPDFLAGRAFDVRFSARDAGGSTFTQTVVRAFSLRAGSAAASRTAPGTASHTASSTASRTASGTASNGTTPAAAAATGTWARPVHRACGSAAPGRVSCLAQWRSGAGAGQLARVAAATRKAVSAPDLGFGPADLAAAYRLDPSRGAGQTVAIVDAYDNPRVEADLAVYRKAWGLPSCTSATGCFRKVNQRGTARPPQADAGWGVEIALDVQAVSAACPRCRILLVEADSESLQDIGTAVNRAVAMGAKVVSNSYGAPEFGQTAALGRRYYTHPGVAIVASSGDDGFQPASFPAVWGSAIAVGGTTLSHTGAAWVEKAWKGAGSGCSAYIAKPAWQHDRHCGMRTTSDLSALADPATGLAVYDTFGLGAENGWVVVGGTSLAAPLVAGMIGAAGNAPKLGTAKWLYDHRSGLKDVVGGSNGYCGNDYLCTGTKGYDGPTGLGSPRGLSAL